MPVMELTAKLLIPAHAEFKVFTKHALPNQDARRDEKVWEDAVMVFENSGKVFALIVLELPMILLERPLWW